ncbi:MAG: hypothetical protein JSU91_03155, partial [Thermoplasmatales archaeon]
DNKNLDKPVNEQKISKSTEEIEEKKEESIEKVDIVNNNEDFDKPVNEQKISKSTEEIEEKKKESIEKTDIKIKKIELFKGLTAIDDETAEVLFDNNIRSISDLRSLSYKELARIKGIKRKIAKKIIRELEEKIKI